MLHRLVTAEPLLALFVTIALGYFVGKLKIGSFTLGGIAGTLLVGVIIGQFGVAIDAGIKGIFFALFIYAVGFQGGPQFFHALNRRSLNQLASAFVMCFTGLLCVLGAAWLFGLDRGMATGLAAGGLTQSAIIGTAGDAIGKLGLSPDLTKIMQTNVAVGYAICYIFGSLGPIIMVSWFLPRVMKWDIRAEAINSRRNFPAVAANSIPASSMPPIRSPHGSSKSTQKATSLVSVRWPSTANSRTHQSKRSTATARRSTSPHYRHCGGRQGRGHRTDSAVADGIRTIRQRSHAS